MRFRMSYAQILQRNRRSCRRCLHAAGILISSASLQIAAPMHNCITKPPEAEQALDQMNFVLNSQTIAAIILLLVCIMSASVRLFSVIKYESVIHEFDPYFNYRVTAFLTRVQHPPMLFQAPGQTSGYCCIPALHLRCSHGDCFCAFNCLRPVNMA